MAYSNEMTNNIRIADCFGAARNAANLYSSAHPDVSPLLFDSGRLQISGRDRKRVRFDPASVSATSEVLGSLIVNQCGHWDYSVYKIKTQYLAMGERKLETFYLSSAEGQRFSVTIVLVGGANGAEIEEQATNISFT